MTVVIQLTKGYTAIVDDEDADLAAFKWQAHINASGTVYARRSATAGSRPANVLMHRVIMQRVLEIELCSRQQVDHKNGIGTDNTRQNLRLATNLQNAHNRKIYSTNKTGVRGVYLCRTTGKFRAFIEANGKRTRLGYYTELEDAAKARREAEKTYFGEFASFTSRQEN